MSEPEEKPGLFGRVKNVFFEQASPKEASMEEQDAPQADAPPTAPESPIDAAGASDFAAAYAQIAGAGDPKTDQVLTAFADMSSQGLNGPPLVTAMTSLIRAFGADAKDIAVTIGKRMEAIGSAVAGQRNTMQNRVAEHGSRAAALVAAGEEEIQALQARIAKLTDQVARVQAVGQEHDAKEQAAFAAFERQASQKTGELHGFARFLADATAKP